MIQQFKILIFLSIFSVFFSSCKISNIYSNFNEVVKEDYCYYQNDSLALSVRFACDFIFTDSLNQKEFTVGSRWKKYF